MALSTIANQIILQNVYVFYDAELDAIMRGTKYKYGIKNFQLQ